MIKQTELHLPAFRRGFHLITRYITEVLPELPEKGLLNIFMHHTSAGLIINENADPTVRHDMESIFNHMVPDNLSFIKHTLEGPDDMPAHLKAALTGVSLNIPISEGRLKLGVWQGVYLCEFRNNGGGRLLTLTVYS